MYEPTIEDLIQVQININEKIHSLYVEIEVLEGEVDAVKARIKKLKGE